MRRRLPLTAIEAFCAVATHLTFRRAAEAIGVSQSALSRHVQNLERDLGLLLFERRATTIVLTEAGRTLFARTDAAFRTVHYGISEAAHACGSACFPPLPPGG